eukprot:gene10457-1896_t
MYGALRQLNLRGSNHPEKWSIDQVAEWVSRTLEGDHPPPSSGESGAAAAEAMRENHVDGKVLCELSEAELKEVGLTLGQRKAVVRSLQQEKDRNQVASGHRGVELQRGYLPHGPELDQPRLEQIRNFEPDFRTGQLVPRAAPLTHEELQCWQDQPANPDSVADVSGHRQGQ